MLGETEAQLQVRHNKIVPVSLVYPVPFWSRHLGYRCKWNLVGSAIEHGKI